MPSSQNATHLALLNHWQRGFPLCAEPFAAIGHSLGMDAEAVLSGYARLWQAGALSRIGAVFAPGAGGASLLAAMAVPPKRLDDVAATVSAHPGVNHNYEREHTTNLWFVATGHDADQVERLLQSIEHTTGLPVQRLPMLRPYRIDTAFDLERTSAGVGDGVGTTGPTGRARIPLASSDWPLAALAEQGLPLTERPYDVWADQLHSSTPAVLATIARWQDEGLLSRFGVVVRHHELGYTANAMAVFDVPDDHVDTHGMALAHAHGVTLAYRRARTPDWRYNLYCMVHGRDRAAVHTQLAQAVAQAGLATCPSAVLFSLRRFKQTGARRFAHHAPHAIPEPMQEAVDALP
ncbi:Lrp/AsnC family transcriptional regulator [Diaphorobacter sp. MNS-0]|uniref:siroheme decarboxylase subunit beta n=1 Tax=Diaphorobacter sp. MNS-0 TaxID=2866628 RepID=UPI001C7324EA|nr:Lrp/AsnC family transcriptional regulator [Diaphorobacter sp. MNS-0]QYY24117.1 Lrp/AsnC family transcriptional regulator [Diaphorobacter sp. MNS-0]